MVQGGARPPSRRVESFRRFRSRTPLPRPQEKTKVSVGVPARSAWAVGKSGGPHAAPLPSFLMVHGNIMGKFAVVLALMFPGPVWALDPPARFDHAFRGPVQVFWLSPAAMQRVCHTWTACTFSTHPKVCRIYVNAGSRGQWVGDAYIRHEVAHCNGWPRDHPR